MWLPDKVIAEVDAIARIDYIDQTLTQRWNEQRKAGELRALTGWCWTARDNSGRNRQMIKSKTACYIDAAETLLGYKGVILPQRRLRVVGGRRAA